MNLQLSKQTYNNFLKYFQKNFDLDNDIKDAFNYIDTPLDRSETVKITFTTTTCSDVHNDIRVTIEFNTYVLFMFYVSVMDHYASTATKHDYYLHGGASLFVLDPNSHGMDNRRKQIERFPLEDAECRELILCMDSKDQDDLFYFVPAFTDVFGATAPVSESRRIRRRKVSAGRRLSNRRKPVMAGRGNSKTVEVYVLQGNYGIGWEDLVEYDDYTEARNDLKEYRENEPKYVHRLITRRVPNPNYNAPSDRYRVLTYTGGFKYKEGNTVKFENIDDAIDYAMELYKDGKEAVLKDAVTGYSVQVQDIGFGYDAEDNIERFRKVVLKDDQ